MVKFAFSPDETNAGSYYFNSVLNLTTVRRLVSGCKHHELTDMLSKVKSLGAYLLPAYVFIDRPIVCFQVVTKLATTVAARHKIQRFR